tara:strand:- start:200 stop:376 length:177 start_codon:yes stop_codon:yes gene_type:complete
MKTSKGNKKSLTVNSNEGKAVGSIFKEDNIEKILCPHCGRTSANGIRCIGMCVADNDY